jgi:peptidyl-dipeptidase Dcp
MIRSGIYIIGTCDLKGGGRLPAERMRLYKPILLLTILICFQFSAQPGQQTGDNRDNPFFAPYQTHFDTPPFDRIKNEHFLPAIKEGIRRHQAEIDTIVKNPAAPDFSNTLGAFDAGGRLLSEVNSVFGALQGAETNPTIQSLAKEISPLLAAHGDNIRLNEKLFARVKAVYDQRDKLKISP